MNRLRIGQIDYLNCLPIFEEFIASHGSDTITVHGVPSVLNRMLSAGEVDVSPSSSIEYAKGWEHYSLLPHMSISSMGPVRSVLLFSKVPIDSLDGCEIALTADSDTSVALLTILLRRRYGFRNDFTRVKVECLDEVVHQSVLLIGDKALRESRRDGWFVYDLGQLWWEFTGLPFVYALWIVRRDACDGSPEEMRMLAQWFREAKERACHSFAVIASRCSNGILSQTELVDYWNLISYDLSSRHIEGLQLFFRMSAEEGIIPCQPGLSFFPDP